MFSCFENSYLLYVIMFRINILFSIIFVLILWSASRPSIQPRTKVTSGLLSMLVFKRWPLVVWSTPRPKILRIRSFEIWRHVACWSLVMLISRSRLVILFWRSIHSFTGIGIPVTYYRRKTTPIIWIWIVCLLSRLSWWCVARKL